MRLLHIAPLMLCTLFDITLLARPPFPNAIVFGSHLTTERLLSALLPLVKPPVWYYTASTDHEALSMTSGTLIVRDVDRLDRPTQRELSHLLEGVPDSLQVISLSGTSLFDRVRRGDFMEGLYYRLNTIVLDLHDVSVKIGRDDLEASRVTSSGAIRSPATPGLFAARSH